MEEIKKLGVVRFNKYDLPRKVHKYGLQGCVRRDWVKKFDNYEYALTKTGIGYIKRGCADTSFDLPVRLMINSVVPPVNPEGMIGDFRKDLYVGLRMPGTLTVDEKTQKAIAAALEAGYSIELWAEAITE